MYIFDKAPQVLLYNIHFAKRYFQESSEKVTIDTILILSIIDHLQTLFLGVLTYDFWHTKLQIEFPSEFLTIGSMIHAFGVHQIDKST